MVKNQTKIQLSQWDRDFFYKSYLLYSNLTQAALSIMIEETNKVLTIIIIIFITPNDVYIPLSEQARVCDSGRAGVYHCGGETVHHSPWTGESWK